MVITRCDSLISEQDYWLECFQNTGECGFQNNAQKCALTSVTKFYMTLKYISFTCYPLDGLWNVHTCVVFEIETFLKTLICMSESYVHVSIWKFIVWLWAIILLYRGFTRETKCCPSLLQGAVSIRKTVLPGMAIPMLKIRRPNGRLIFNMEIAIRR